MILGTGVDIVEVERIRAAIERHGNHFILRFLRPEEWAYCQSHRDPAPAAAARFAAKEAISKAFGTGIGAKLNWLDMEICRKDSGQPCVVLHERGAELFSSLQATAIHLSLSHTANYATATAILEK